MPWSKRRLSACAILICIGQVHLFADDRKQLTVLRVPNDSITIDGRDDDWRRIPAADLARTTATSDDPARVMVLSPDRGNWAGPDDCSMTARFALDDANLYVAAYVRDQFLTNTSNM